MKNHNSKLEPIDMDRLNRMYPGDPVAQYGVFRNLTFVGRENGYVTLRDKNGNEKCVFESLFLKHGFLTPMTTPHTPAPTGEQTPTPRTDSATSEYAVKHATVIGTVDAAFARQLERENAELRKALELFVNPFLLDSIDDIERDYGFGTAQQHKSARQAIARASVQGGAQG